jgi:hypothetical protein
VSKYKKTYADGFKEGIDSCATLRSLARDMMTEFSKQHDLYVIIEKVVNEYDRVRSRVGKCERD